MPVKHATARGATPTGTAGRTGKRARKQEGASKPSSAGRTKSMADVLMSAGIKKEPTEPPTLACATPSHKHTLDISTPNMCTPDVSESSSTRRKRCKLSDLDDSATPDKVASPFDQAAISEAKGLKAAEDGMIAAPDPRTVAASVVNTSAPAVDAAQEAPAAKPGASTASDNTSAKAALEPKADLTPFVDAFCASEGSSLESFLGMMGLNPANFDNKEFLQRLGHAMLQKANAEVSTRQLAVKAEKPMAPPPPATEPQPAAPAVPATTSAQQGGDASCEDDFLKRMPAEAQPETPAVPATSAQQEGGASTADAAEDAPLVMPGQSGIPAPRPIGLPKGVPIPKFDSREARKKVWQQYLRTMNENQTRADRIEKAGDDFLKRMLGCHEQSYYFAIWVAHDKSWGNVRIFEEHLHLERNLSEQRYRWLTEAQMMDLYKCEDVVREMKLAKGATPQLVRPHPELPHVVKAKQYKCLISDEQVRCVEDILRQGIRLDGEAQGQSAAMLVQQRIAQSATALGHSVMPTAPARQPAGSMALTAPVEESTKPSTGVPSPASKEIPDSGLTKSDHERALALLEADQKKKQDRLERLQQKQKERDELKETDGFKANKWLMIYGQLVEAAQKEVTNLTKFQKDDVEGSGYPKTLPGGIAREYCETFKNEKRTLTAKKAALKKAMDGEGGDQVKKQLANIDTAAEKFKSMHRTWKILVRRYEKNDS